MKRIFTLLMALWVFSAGKSFAQSCKILGCADTYGTQTADGTLPDNTTGILGGCYGAGTPFKQVFWQFFFSPVGGEYKQAFTPIGSNGLDLDYIVYDLGVDDPGVLSCPVDPENAATDWNQMFCNNETSIDIATGPGQPSPQGDVLMTTAMHYYAIAIVFYQSGPGPYSFSIGTPTINTGGGDVPLSPASCTNIVLPVKLAIFNASVNHCTVDIDWISMSETNFNKYEVQYSIDGTNFTTIESKAASGINQVYSFRHNSPAQGVVFYRLKMIDLDGGVGYSKTISANVTCNQNLVAVYPNPVKDKLTISIADTENSAIWANLFDNSGRLVYTGKLVNGTNSVDMAKLAKGLYLLTVKSDKAIQNVKIIK